MTEQGKALSLAGVSVVILGCVGWLVVCPHRPLCLNSVTELDSWASVAPWVAIPLLALSLAALGVRLVWMLARTAIASNRLPRLEVVPASLEEAAARTRVSRLVCVTGNAPSAFCVGALKPRIVVSEGLVRCLRSQELYAVLLHELDHSHRLEPLRRAAQDAAAEIFFYIPLLRWCVRRQIENSELRADRAALERLGPRPVAAALWMLGSGTPLEGVAAFAGVAELRVAQILGDPVSRAKPEFSTVALSVLGLYLALQVGSCLAQVATHLI